MRSASLFAPRRTPQGDAELMTERQVLDLRPAMRFEQVDDEHSERVQSRRYRVQPAGAFGDIADGATSRDGVHAGLERSTNHKTLSVQRGMPTLRSN